MIPPFHKITLPILLGISVTLWGCGGDGGGGNSASPTYTGAIDTAKISASNAEVLGITATEAVQQSVTSTTAKNSVPFGLSISASPALLQIIRDTSASIVSNAKARHLPIGMAIHPDEFGPNYCGGSATISDEIIDGDNFSATITYNNICYDDGENERIIMNGTLSYFITETAFSITFSNFSITVDGITETINATVTCGEDLTSICSFSTDYVGKDGVTYRVSDFDVNGDATSGYSVNATFFHPDYGSVEIQTTSPVTFNCPAERPDSGAISFTGSSGTSGSMSFNSCETYTYCYNEGSGEMCDTGTW
ncbi:MAG: hypothetical protein GXP08_03385 [Gammaproteobacteria bacterium]|nr:hypothetical protein [Gammaproteobacteria bacterium]